MLGCRAVVRTGVIGWHEGGGEGDCERGRGGTGRQAQGRAFTAAVAELQLPCQDLVPRHHALLPCRSSSAGRRGRCCSAGGRILGRWRRRVRRPASHLRVEGAG